MDHELFLLFPIRCRDLFARKRGIASLNELLYILCFENVKFQLYTWKYYHNIKLEFYEVRVPWNYVRHERRKVGNVGCGLSTYDRRTAQRDNERIVDGLSMRRPTGERRGLSFA